MNVSTAKARHNRGVGAGIAVILLSICVLAVVSVASGETLPRQILAQYAESAKRMDTLPPTPIGEGHLGQLPPGKVVQLRFPVPHAQVAGYWLHLGNVVGFSGKGSSYQLILHRNTADGPVLHTGPVITDGDAWNAQNRIPVDITESITESDRKHGAVDIFVTAKVEKDNWTVYRHNPGRPIFATVAVLTPEIAKRVALHQKLATRGIALLPMPRKISLIEGPDLRLLPGSSILPADPASRTAAEELAAVVSERIGVQLRTSQSAESGHVVLRIAKPGSPEVRATAELRNPEGYVLRIDGKTAQVTGGGPAGAFYGAMTLGQMLRKGPEGALVAPACEVRDAPAFPERIIQYDIARGQTVNVEYVKRLIRAFARCKVNAILFYMEDDFKFRKYPFLGRPGTFTHEKARTLSEYAHRYHMQLIPQFESLGHAAALLRHPELKDLRENGGAWDFCTTNPGTWAFLDDVFGELVDAFPYSHYLHVGGDEFETGFGKCPKCRAIAEKDGIGALYAMHMNKLNRLVKKHRRVMLFWPSHSGPTAALSRMTIQNANLLDKDMVPTEWIYHGPATYPTIDTYQKLGFTDVFCSPAVVDYSRVWPDFPTTFRGISGFFRYGADRKCGGAYCTTWEFMHGALVENSMYGLLYAAECAWNPFDAVRADFDRRFGGWWLGLDAAQARELTALLYQPIPTSGKDARFAGFWRGGRNATSLLWLAPKRVLPEWVLRTPQALEKAAMLARSIDAAAAKVEGIDKHTGRNRLTLRAAHLAFAMLRYAAHKPLRLHEATRLYARQQKDTPNTADLDKLATVFAGLADEARACASEYGYFVDHCGAYPGDAKNLTTQAKELAKSATAFADLAKKVKAGIARTLPPAGTFGLVSGRAVRLGEWAPETVSEKGSVLRFPVSPSQLKGVEELQVSWEYTRGAHGLTIHACRLVCDGKTVAEDRHTGWAGSGSHDNNYTLAVKAPVSGGKYEIVGEVASSGGTDSHGQVWIILPESRK